MLLNILLLQHTAETCTGCFWCWAIWMFLSAMLGLLIGRWIWGKYAILAKQKDKALKVVQEKNIQVEKNFVAAKYQIAELEKDNKGLKASFVNFEKEMVILSTQLSRSKAIKNTEIENIHDTDSSEDKKIEIVQEEVTVQPAITKKEKAPSNPTIDTPPSTSLAIEEEITNIDTPKALLKPSAPLPPISYGDLLKPDNLKMIEGIGPKIEEILNKAGYNNWSDIANAKVADLKNLLHDSGPRYRIHNPSTWSQQAKLAIKGDWENLIDLQKILSSKRTGEEIEQSIPKIKKLVAKKFGFENVSPDDLKIIEGIGSKIEELLKRNGIKNWIILGTTPLSKIQAILSDAGEKYKLADPATWPKQAMLAHKKEWIKLRTYQDGLHGGRTA